MKHNAENEMNRKKEMKNKNTDQNTKTLKDETIHSTVIANIKTPEAAETLGLTETCVRALAYNGFLGSTQGKSRNPLFTRADLAAFKATALKRIPKKDKAAKREEAKSFASLGLLIHRVVDKCDLHLKPFDNAVHIAGSNWEKAKKAAVDHPRALSLLNWECSEHTVNESLIIKLCRERLNKAEPMEFREQRRREIPCGSSLRIDALAILFALDNANSREEQEAINQEVIDAADKLYADLHNGNKGTR